MIVTYVSHKLDVVNEISLFLGGILLEFAQLHHENVEMSFELSSVMIRLALHSVLQLS